MGLIATLLGFVVTLFILLLIVRMILDWVSLAGRAARTGRSAPGGWPTPAPSR
ncbi:hypothetical protein [Kutzneria kofuensis]|uniref:hypothetical protein n=1 Tax=Kutzneria kofuensis TaxID=103725 RepID=UPI0031EFB297